MTALRKDSIRTFSAAARAASSALDRTNIIPRIVIPAS